MSFSGDEEDDPRQRKRARGKGQPSESPWPRKDQPLSWAMLPPEENGEEGEVKEGEEQGEPAGSATSAETAKGLPPPPPPSSEEDWRSRYQYLMAEFDNYRRRVQRETEAAVTGARGKILLKVLGLHEGIESALSALPPDARSLRDGLSMVLKNMDQLLKEEEVQPVAAEGSKFQPELHEAVGQVPATAKAPEGTVAVVVQQGYRGPTGLLRAAKVLVASGAAPPPTKGGKGSG